MVPDSVVYIALFSLADSWTFSTVHSCMLMMMYLLWMMMSCLRSSRAQSLQPAPTPRHHCQSLLQQRKQPQHTRGTAGEGIKHQHPTGLGLAASSKPTWGGGGG